MIKKIAIGVVLFIVIAGVGIFLFETFQPQKFSNSLSKRSEEFIRNKEQEEGASQFSELLKKPGEDTRGKRIDVNSCFSFVMPFQVFNAREEEECGGYFAFERPKGTIVVYMRNGGNLTFDNLEGVSFRRQNPDIYQEGQKKIEGREFLLFGNLKEPYQKTAYFYEGNSYLVLTLTSPGGEEEKMDVYLEDILQSLKLGKITQNMEQ